jgi:hypothetical protein
MLGGNSLPVTPSQRGVLSTDLPGRSLVHYAVCEGSPTLLMLSSTKVPQFLRCSQHRKDVLIYGSVPPSTLYRTLHRRASSRTIHKTRHQQVRHHLQSTPRSCRRGSETSNMGSNLHFLRSRQLTCEKLIMYYIYSNFMSSTDA